MKASLLTQPIRWARVRCTVKIYDKIDVRIMILPCLSDSGLSATYDIQAAW